MWLAHKRHDGNATGATNRLGLQDWHERLAMLLWYRCQNVGEPGHTSVPMPLARLFPRAIDIERLASVVCLDKLLHDIAADTDERLSGRVWSR